MIFEKKFVRMVQLRRLAPLKYILFPLLDYSCAPAGPSGNKRGTENSRAPPSCDISLLLYTVSRLLIQGKLLTDLHFDRSLDQQRLFCSHLNLPHFVSRLQL